MNKWKHTQTPWGDDLTPLIRTGDKRVLLGFFQEPPKVDCRILAEGNFQFAKNRVNAHDFLIGVLKKIKISCVDEETFNLCDAALKKVKGEQL